MDNLIICEFCGTAYSPEEGRCPICQGAAADTENYMGDHYDFDERPVEEETPEKQPIAGKVAALIALVALLLGFTFYILYSFEAFPFLKPSSSASAAPAQKACTQLAIDVSELNLMDVGESAVIQTAVLPSDTTDRIIFSIDDSSVASVTQDGTVTAKAPGSANITVICGSLMAYCKLNCTFPDAVPAAPAEPEPEPAAPTEPLAINKDDISFFEAGESFVLTVTGGDGSDPAWESSDDAIATVDAGGLVQAVGSGTATITATVGGESITCIVRCQF